MYPGTLVIWVVNLTWLPLALAFRILNHWWFPLSIHLFIPVLRLLSIRVRDVLWLVPVLGVHVEVKVDPDVLHSMTEVELPSQH